MIARNWDDIVILTMLMHLFALSSALPAYSTLVAASTAASVAWHLNEQDRRLLLLDYGLAFAWGLTDACMDLRTIPLNLLTIAALFALESHSLWHLVSAAKAAAVTHLLLAG